VEGAALRQPDDAETLALAIASALSTGQGGLDYAGFPLMVEYFGVADVAGLLQRLLVIKSYRKPAERGEAPT
jgi:hypothetical protein